MTDDPITVSDDDDGLAAALSDRINEFNTAGFPHGQARVVQIRTGSLGPDCTINLGNDEVEVELATNAPPHEYPYFVHIERRHDRWFEGISHN